MLAGVGGAGGCGRGREQEVLVVVLRSRSQKICSFISRLRASVWTLMDLGHAAAPPPLTSPTSLFSP